jgi:Xaa-Pro aminopeptidase
VGNLIEKRVEILRKNLEKNNLDTFMVLVEQNRYYLSGYTGEDTQFDETAGALFITPDQLVLATDSRFDLQAKHEAPLYEIITYKKGLEKEIPSITQKLNTKRLGFESIRLTFLQFQKIRKVLNEQQQPDLELIGTENMVEKLRMIKEESEIDTLKDSLKIAEDVFNEFIPHLKAGMTEKEISWWMEKRMREAGADALSFPSIVASGPNSALPHAIASDRKIREGEPVLFDWGVKLKGYCSDISRTVILGTPDPTFRKIFQTVYDAQQKAIDAIKPGMTGKQVDQVAREYIDRTEFKGKFAHGLGHGTGLAVHEGPRLSPLREDLLEPGMVVTVEPGIYIPEWGGVRLENMVVVRDHGAEVLNKTDSSRYSCCGLTHDSGYSCRSVHQLSHGRKRSFIQYC